MGHGERTGGHSGCGSTRPRRQRRPNSVSISAFDSRRNVGTGRGCRSRLLSVASIWRSSASISARARRRPARILPWHAIRAITASSRDDSAIVSSSSDNSSAISRINGAASGAPQRGRKARTSTAPGPNDLELQAQMGEFFGSREQSGGVGLRQVVDDGGGAAKVARAPRPPACGYGSPHGSDVHARRAGRPGSTSRRRRPR